MGDKKGITGFLYQPEDPNTDKLAETNLHTKQILCSQPEKLLREGLDVPVSVNTQNLAQVRFVT